MSQICAVRHIITYQGAYINVVVGSLLLYSIRVRRYLSEQSARPLVPAPVISRLDGCNSLLMDLPDTLFTSPTACAECLRQNDTWDGQVRACHADADGASLVAHEKPHPVQSTATHIKDPTTVGSLLTYKYMQEPGLEYLRDLLDCYVPARRLRSAGKLLLHRPMVRSSNGERAFSHLAPTPWNALPLWVRACTSLAHFKVSLETHLFVEYLMDYSLLF